MTRYDMGNWETGADALVALLRLGKWRHGLKTEDAAKVIVSEGGFPADPNTMLVEKWRKKSRDFLKLGLYYFTQLTLKNEYEVVIGKRTGKPHRVRSFYCVPHGLNEIRKNEHGQPIDENGTLLTRDEIAAWEKQAKRTKEGLWLRFLDLNPVDIRWLARRYRAREEDSGPVKKLIWTAEDRSVGLPDTITMADILDDILEAM
jgi:hypothetical protein